MRLHKSNSESRNQKSYDYRSKLLFCFWQEAWITGCRDDPVVFNIQGSVELQHGAKFYTSLARRACSHGLASLQVLWQVGSFHFHCNFYLPDKLNFQITQLRVQAWPLPGQHPRPDVVLLGGLQALREGFLLRGRKAHGLPGWLDHCHDCQLVPCAVQCLRGLCFHGGHVLQHSQCQHVECRVLRVPARVLLP